MSLKSGKTIRMCIPLPIIICEGIYLHYFCNICILLDIYKNSIMIIYKEIYMLVIKVLHLVWSTRQSVGCRRCKCGGEGGGQWGFGAAARGRSPPEQVRRSRNACARRAALRAHRGPTLGSVFRRPSRYHQSLRRPRHITI